MQGHLWKVLILLGVWIGTLVYGYQNPVRDIAVPHCDILGRPEATRGHQSYGRWQLEFNPEISDCDPQIADFLAERNRYGKGIQPDQTNLFSVGVDPATLSPQAVDLNIFPSFPISDQLTLSPSLAYAPDALATRSSLIRYNPPKNWRNHYGELVRLVGPLREQKLPLGRHQATPFGGEEGDRDSVSFEIQTYFINAKGQQVNFYPDPDDFGVADPDGEPLVENPGDFLAGDHIQTWFSEQGLYRLVDRNQAPNDQFFDFELRTPEGLIFEFERYKVETDAVLEALSVHFRVTRIIDRYGNYLVVSYVGDSLRTDAVRAYKADISNPGSTNFFQQIRYEYDGNDRLTQIIVPKYTGSSNFDHSVSGEQIFELLYPEMSEQVELAAIGSVSLNGSSVGLQPLYTSATESEAYATTLNGSIELDLSELPMVLGLAVDFHDNTELKAHGYLIKLFRDDGQGGQLEFIFRQSGFHSEQLQQRTGPLAPFIPPLNHRYRRLNPNPAFPDQVYTYQVGGTRKFNPTDEGAYGIEIYPLLKDGDRIVAANGAIASLKPDYPHCSAPNGTCDFDLNEVPVEPANALPANGQGFHLREDNFFRVREIRFPDPGGASTGRKRMVFDYSDNSMNHQEVAQISIFHGATEIQRTNYRYERIRTYHGSADVYDSVAAVGERFLRCSLPTTSSTPVPFGPYMAYGLNFSNERELEILREKHIRYLIPGSSALSAAMSTYYGGAYHAVLAGAEDHSIMEPGQTQPPYCNRIQWGLDAKPFQFTWEISPDGSATVFDLDPGGLGLPADIADYNRRRRAFKTYFFDTNFKAKFGAEFPHLLDDPQPFYKFLPGYNQSTAAVANTIDPEFPTPTLTDLFSWRTAQALPTKCYRAQVTAFEFVPMYKYGQATRGNNGWDFMRREAVQLLHNELLSYNHGIGGTARRGSAIHNVIQSNDIDGNAERLLKGAYVDDLTLANGVTVWKTIHWQRGGRTDFGNRYIAFFDRQKILRLQPQFVYELRDYDGFTMANGMIDFNPSTDFVKGTQFSNGGFLDQYTFSSTVIPTAGPTPGTATISNFNLTNPPGKGDVMLYKGNNYNVLDVNAGTITFSPPIVGTLDPGATFEFYRYANPFKVADEQYAKYNGYRGYDAFGNNGFQAQYFTGNSGLTWSGRVGAELIPDVDLDHAESLTWNDSSAWSNQDTENWQFFGRTTRQFNSHSLPFYDATNTMSVTPVYSRWGQVSTWDYELAAYPWLVTQETLYYTPYGNDNQSLAEIIDNFETAVPATHSEDQIKTSSYVETNSGNPLAAGRLAAQRRFKRGTSGDFQNTSFLYDNHGRLEHQEESSFQQSGSPYGLRTSWIRDGNTGLPIEALTSVGSASINGTAVALDSLQIQSRGFNHYDAIGRVSKSYVKVPKDDDPTNQEYLFGPVNHTLYYSPLKQEQRTTKGLDLVTSTPLQTVIQYTDGLNRPVLTMDRYGTSGHFQVTGLTYDSEGRVDKSFYPKEFDSATSSSLSHYFNIANDAYTQSHYNLRSEEAGSVDVTDGDATQATWHTQAIDNDGLLVSFDYYQDQLSANSRLNIKQHQHDAYGQKVSIRDFEFPGPEGILTDLTTAENFLNSLLIGPLLDPNDAVTRGTYAYDRFGNMLSSETGINGAQQSRSIQFDSFSRLLRESHPEMDHDVVYSQFDLFNNPKSIDLGAGRSQHWTYDAWGNPLSVSFKENAVQKQFYSWTYTGSDSRYPGFPEMITAEDSASAEGIAYLFTYHPDHGKQISKQMIHSFPGISAGQVADVTSPDWSNALVLTYEYDPLGRLQSMSYPSAVSDNNNAPTSLHMEYADETGMLSRVIDSSLDNLVLLDHFEYEGGLLKSYEFGLVDGGNHRIVREYDAYKRIGLLGFDTGQVGPVAQFTSKYAYDARNRVKTIANSWLTPLASGNDDFFNRYTYDTLGQLVNAEIPVRHTDGNSTFGEVFDFQFEYDGWGLGNMSSYRRNGQEKLLGTPDPNSNRITTPNNQIGYTPQGEIDQYHDLATAKTFSMQYGADGRMRQVDQDSTSERFGYDAMGMRVFKHNSQTGESRLYFYDSNNQVTTEWLGQDSDTRWDVHYVRAGDNNAITYEYTTEPDPNQPPVASGQPALKSFVPPPAILTSSTTGTNAVLKWGQSDEFQAYDLQIGVVNPEQIDLIYSARAIQNTALNHKLAPGDYVQRVRVTGGNWSDWQAFSVVEQFGNETLLTPPGQLEVSSVSANQISLTWVNREPTQTGLQLERSSGQATWNLIASLNGTTTSYLDNSLSPDTHYRYRLQATTASEQSDFSNLTGTRTDIYKALSYQFDVDQEGWTNNGHISGTTIVSGVLEGQSIGADPQLISPSFSINGDDAKVVHIRLMADNGVARLFWQTTAEPFFSQSKSHTFYLTTDGVLRDYFLDLSGNQYWSGQTITKLRLDPVNLSGANFGLDFMQSSDLLAAPTNLDAQPIGSRSVILTWQDQAENEDGFTVERSPSGQNVWQEIAHLGPNVDRYQDSGLASGTAFDYRVRAVGVPASSGFTPVATVSTAYRNGIDYQFVNGTDHWHSRQDTEPVFASNGHLIVEANGTAPSIIATDLEIHGDDAPNLGLRMRHSEGTTASLYWTTSSNSQFDSSKVWQITLGPPNSFGEYQIDLSNHPNWSGQRITSLRLDLPEQTSEVDYLIATSLDPVSFRFDQTREGWVMDHHLAPAVISEGSLNSSATGQDPYMIHHGINFSGATVPKISVRMKVDAGTHAQLFWKTTADPSFSQVRSQSVSLITDGQYHNYLFDLSSHTQWNSEQIISLRLDPANAQGATFAIDSIVGYALPQ